MTRRHAGCRRRLKFGGYSCGDVALSGRVILCDGCARGEAILVDVVDAIAKRAERSS